MQNLTPVQQSTYNTPAQAGVFQPGGVSGSNSQIMDTYQDNSMATIGRQSSMSSGGNGNFTGGGAGPGAGSPRGGIPDFGGPGAAAAGGSGGAGGGLPVGGEDVGRYGDGGPARRLVIERYESKEWIVTGIGSYSGVDANNMPYGLHCYFGHFVTKVKTKLRYTCP